MHDQQFIIPQRHAMFRSLCSDLPKLHHPLGAQAKARDLNTLAPDILLVYVPVNPIKAVEVTDDDQAVVREMRLKAGLITAIQHMPRLISETLCALERLPDVALRGAMLGNAVIGKKR